MRFKRHNLMKRAIPVIISLLLPLAMSAQGQAAQDAAKAAAWKSHAAAISEYLSTDYPGSIVSVKVSGDKVCIRGRKPSGDNIFLTEITPWEEVYGPGIEDGLVAVKGRRFKVSLPRMVERDGIVYDRALSRWALVEKTPEGVALASHARYADVIPALFKAPRMELKGKKGLGGYRLNRFQEDLESLGIGSVTINIHLNSLLYASERPDAIPYEYGGITYWFDSARVDYLDRVLSYCTDRGVVTSAITLIDLRSADPTLTPVFRHPDCDGGFYSMPNMTTPAGFNAYAAVLDFLAGRYSTGEHGRINNWIIHNEVDYGFGWTNMGHQSYEAYMDAYEKSMRLNYNIAVAYDQNCWVLGSYTHNWNVPEDENGFPVTRMLDDHLRYSRLEGDFRWGVAQHPYPQDLFAPEFWKNDTRSTYDTGTDYLTFKNLEVIDKWIRDKDRFYRGKTKRLLFLSENGTNSPSYSETDLTNQAAGACWAWKKISALPGIDAVQWHAWIDDRGEFGLRIGLRRFPDDEEEPGGVKPVWKVWEAAGTPSEDEVFAPYLKVIGLGSWQEIFHEVGK